MANNALQKEAALMQLGDLIKAREHWDKNAFPIADAELLDRYEKLYTGIVSDVLREHVQMDQAMPNRIKALRPERTVAGFAFTVKSAPNALVTGEMTVRVKMLDEMRPLDFVVWDASSDQNATMWGGVMTATAHRIGVRAACIDGGIRDTRQILERDFPVFYGYHSPNGSLGRCQISHYQVPIQIGSVLVKPGDVLLGDIDGVIVVPRNLAYAVLVRAEEIRRNECQIFDWVESGDSVQEITKKGGYF